MKKHLFKFLRSTLNCLGIDLIRLRNTNTAVSFPIDFELNDIKIIDKVRPYTYTSPERIHALSQAVKYVSKNNIPGSIVECGIWRGGSSMAAMLTLIDLGIQDRDFYLYDTYEGMSEPTESDVSIKGDNALKLFNDFRNEGKNWVYSSLNEVKKNVYGTGYDQHRIHFVEGKVEDTLAHNLPDKISILRLDTDWYESTMAEMQYLFPRLTKGGVLIIDDYGHWKGAKKAVDEYFDQFRTPILLTRIDYTGRLGIKLY
ncbi:MAG: TylF/MycF/NovP-related O-methyltransferase [Balneolales bacterium]